jgi:hypothetical protein
MLNRAPVILHCFSRGGSNIFWNIFLTHPDLCSPIYETLQIFRINWRAPRIEGVKVVLLSRQWRLFDQWHLHERRAVPRRAQAYIDRTLYDWKLRTYSDVDMRYKRPDEVYTLEEVRNARLVVKNNNALAFLSDMFLEMYPDVTFFALVRDPLALYETHLRHRTPVAASVEAFADYYEGLAGRMMRDAERIENYHVLQFEDVLSDPVGEARRLYRLARLDPDKVHKLRFKAKPRFQPNGTRRTRFPEGRHHWFAFEDVHEILDPGINRYHVDRLGEVEKSKLSRLTEVSRELLGYEESPE